MNKGDYGYLNRYKKQYALFSLGIGAVMAAVIGIGLWLNKGDIKNIYTVIGILFALPLAKFLSGLLVVVRMKTVDETVCREITKTISHAGSDQFLWDLALSSQEKVRHIPCLIWSDHHVLIWMDQKDAGAQKYFSNMMKNNCHRVEITITDSRESFQKAAAKINFGVTSEEEWERIKETILIYEM